MPREIRLEHTKEQGRCVSMRKNDWGERLVGTDQQLQQKLNYNPCKLIGQTWSASKPATALLSNGSLTENDEKAD